MAETEAAARELAVGARHVLLPQRAAARLGERGGVRVVHARVRQEREGEPDEQLQPREQEKLLQAQNHLREAYRLLAFVRKAIASEPVKDSPAQQALRASVVAVKYAGSSLSDSIKGARRLKAGTS